MNYFPAKKNLLQDDIVFNENRVYVFASYTVSDPSNNTYESRIVIVKPQMQNDSIDLFKKRLHEKRDRLESYGDPNTKQASDVFLRRIPNDNEAKFF